MLFFTDFNLLNCLKKLIKPVVYSGYCTSTYNNFKNHEYSQKAAVQVSKLRSTK